MLLFSGVKDDSSFCKVPDPWEDMDMELTIFVEVIYRIFLTIVVYRCKLKLRFTLVNNFEGRKADMIPSISDSELEIMKIIWRDKRTTTNKIIEELADEVEWKPNTVKTLVNRLLNKNAISFDKAGKEYYYYPLVMKEEYIEKESESFINKFFNGSINSMLLNFVKNQKISAKDIEELQYILNNNKE